MTVGLTGTVRHELGDEVPPVPKPAKGGTAREAWVVVGLRSHLAEARKPSALANEVDEGIEHAGFVVRPLQVIWLEAGLAL